MKRETFEEHSLKVAGRFYRVQFFMPKLWRFGFKFQVNRDRAHPMVKAYGNRSRCRKPIAQIKTGWTLALPTMSIKYVHSSQPTENPASIANGV